MQWTISLLFLTLVSNAFAITNEQKGEVCFKIAEYYKNKPTGCAYIDAEIDKVTRWNVNLGFDCIESFEHFKQVDGNKNGPAVPNETYQYYGSFISLDFTFNCTVRPNRSHRYWRPVVIDTCEIYNQLVAPPTCPARIR